MIRVNQLFKLHQQLEILRDITFDVTEGEMFGVIGPNGSGKSTLLKLLSGVERPTSGEIRLNGNPVERNSRKDLAKWLAVLQQDALPPVGFTVREVVEMGRYPFQNWLGEEAADCAELIDAIIRDLGLGALEHRTLEQLSGGERQRVALGKVMAQQPRLLMLDEPTTYLDIGYQIALMDSVRRWRQWTNLTVIAVLHDLNLAAQYCDRILLIHQGRQVKVGTPDEIMDENLLSQVYGVRPIILRHPISDLPQILLQSGS